MLRLPFPEWLGLLFSMAHPLFWLRNWGGGWCCGARQVAPVRILRTGYSCLPLQNTALGLSTGLQRKLAVCCPLQNLWCARKGSCRLNFRACPHTKQRPTLPCLALSAAIRGPAFRSGWGSWRAARRHSLLRTASQIHRSGLLANAALYFCTCNFRPPRPSQPAALVRPQDAGQARRVHHRLV